MEQPRSSTPSRRRVAQAAWAAPAVLATVAAPAASASTPKPTPTPTPTPRYALDKHGTGSTATVTRGNVEQPWWGYDPATGAYMQYTKNATITGDSKTPDWAVERKESTWENLTPGKRYTFTMSAELAPYYRCPAGTSSKILLVYSSSTGSKWTQNANFRSHPRASVPPDAKAPATTFTSTLKDDYCTLDYRPLWPGKQSVTFTQKAGPDGKIHLRFDVWMRSRKTLMTPNTHPTGNNDYSYNHEAATGNAFLRFWRPEIVG